MDSGLRRNYTVGGSEFHVRPPHNPQKTTPPHLPT